MQSPAAYIKSPLGAIPQWQKVAHRFPSERDCLASFVAFESAEVLAGAKPANLVNIANRPKPCGRNLYALWKAHGEELLGESRLRARVLRDRGGSLLVLLHSAALGELLETPRARAFLRKAGYPSYEHWEEALHILERRVRSSTGFPHEIGLFLGYPLKDVAGFIGWVPLPLACQGPWKMYGDPAFSLELARRHRDCRSRMVKRLSSVRDPGACLRFPQRRVSCA